MVSYSQADHWTPSPTLQVSHVIRTISIIKLTSLCCQNHRPLVRIQHNKQFVDAKLNKRKAKSTVANILYYENLIHHSNDSTAIRCNAPNFAPGAYFIDSTSYQLKIKSSFTLLYQYLPWRNIRATLLQYIKYVSTFGLC